MGELVEMKKRKRGKEKIVKVQISQFTMKGEKQVLVHNQDKSFNIQFPISDLSDPALGSILPPKSFWYAYVDSDKNLILDRPHEEDDLGW